MCFICSLENGFETDIYSILEFNNKQNIEVNIIEQKLSNNLETKSIDKKLIQSDSFKPIDTKYLIMGFADGIDQIEMRKSFAGEEKQIKVYISNGKDLNKVLNQTARLLFTFSLGLSIGLII